MGLITFTEYLSRDLITFGVGKSPFYIRKSHGLGWAGLGWAGLGWFGTVNVNDLAWFGMVWSV
jgi:hypothetical protein